MRDYLFLSIVLPKHIIGPAAVVWDLYVTIQLPTSKINELPFNFKVEILSLSNSIFMV